MKAVAVSMVKIYSSLDSIGEKLHRKKIQGRFHLKALAASLCEIYSSNEPIGQKLCRKIQEVCPLKAITNSMVNMYSSLEPIGEKLHRKFKRDTLWGPYLPQWPTFIPQLNLLMKKFTGGIVHEGWPIGDVSASFTKIYFSIKPIGEKLHQNILEGCPMRAVPASLADINF